MHFNTAKNCLQRVGEQNVLTGVRLVLSMQGRGSLLCAPGSFSRTRVVLTRAGSFNGVLGTASFPLQFELVTEELFQAGLLSFSQRHELAVPAVAWARSARGGGPES